MTSRITSFVKKYISVRNREIIKNYKIYIFLQKLFRLNVYDKALDEWTHARRNNSNPVLLKNEAGINIIGFLSASTGLGNAAHNSTQALQTTDVLVNSINFESGRQSKKNKTLDLERSSAFKFDINLIHINPPEYQELWRQFGTSLTRYNIGVWYWELTDLPDHWLKCFDVLDEIWVASRFVQETIQKKSPIPVIKMSPSIQVELNLSLIRKDFNLPDDTFLFLSAYDVHSVSERKNPLATINAFKRAFTARTMDVGLVMKVRNSNHDREFINQIKREISGYPNCYLIEESFSKIKFNTLLNLVDAYISLHRSEGFGLIPAESMFLGKPVVMTNWSGNTDFMTPDNSCGVNYRLVPVKPGVPFYEAGKLWADPDISHAVDLMQSLFYNRAYYQKISSNAKEYIQYNLSPQKIGIAMKQRLQTITGKK
jgi:glycosyltransferase involved in cell wall biosynthesis